MSMIRIARPSQNLINKFPKKYVEFYFGYANVITETLKWPSFQNFLNWMIKEENINKNKIVDIQVKIFPFKKRKGKGLAGRCSKKGQIKIYPRRIKFLSGLLMKTEEEKLDLYVKARAMSTLIHELLHIKYLSDEEKVKKLTKNYFDIFNLHWQRSNHRSPKTCRMLKYNLSHHKREPRCLESNFYR
ncbi:MAG: hypothetical protein ACE5OV_01370 [Candidatus Bathyarchaeia archaeon]